jgi:N-acetyl-anhydromuramyl-L-alanine amidase AmpD
MKLRDLTINASLRAKHLGDRLEPICGIILHDTAGSGTHNDTVYLSNPSDGRVVSVDFTAERDGSIWQLSPDLRKFATFHAGRKTRFREFLNRDVTLRTIGIQPTYPQTQIEAVAGLCAALCGELRLSSGDITTHAAVITDGSRTDPRKFDFDAFWLAFRNAVGQGDAAVVAHGMEKIVAPSNVSEKAYSVKQGDTLTKIARKFGTTVEAIKVRNNLQSDLILVGQSLVIPAA